MQSCNQSQLTHYSASSLDVEWTRHLLPSLGCFVLYFEAFSSKRWPMHEDDLKHSFSRRCFKLMMILMTTTLIMAGSYKTNCHMWPFSCIAIRPYYGDDDHGDDNDGDDGGWCWCWWWRWWLKDWIPRQRPQSATTGRVKAFSRATTIWWETWPSSSSL